MSLIRTILFIYRKVQYFVCGRCEYGIMPQGTLCSHEAFEEEINHGDVVHPCVRYIPEGYEGHCWWMVYTPYFAANEKTENPILFYAESNDNTPPTEWKFLCQVQKQPEKGYNSDPTLFYDNGILYVIWRENFTSRCENAGFVRACFATKVQVDGVGKIFGPLVGTKESEVDTEVSPTFFRSNDGIYHCYAMHLKFHSLIIGKLPYFVKKPILIISSILDLLGIWSQQKSYGIAQWSSNFMNEAFHFERTIKFCNKNVLYRPWHMDFFEYKNKLYAIVQTNQCNADVCLAVSEDGTHFRFYKKPLMTNATCGKMGIYKPTGGVIDGVFYLYYTAQDIDNRALNKLYLSKSDFSSVIIKIQ